MRNVRKVQRGQAAAPGLVGGMDQVYMSSQQLATMRASRPLPEFPEDTHETGDWRLKWDHAWKVHSMGMPEAYHLDILGQKLPPRLQELLQNLVLGGKKGVPVTYDMFMDYLMSRETTNPYVGRQRWANMAGPSANTLEALEDFRSDGRRRSTGAMICRSRRPTRSSSTSSSRR